MKCLMIKEGTPYVACVVIDMAIGNHRNLLMVCWFIVKWTFFNDCILIYGMHLLLSGVSGRWLSKDAFIYLVVEPGEAQFN